ncbi:MAG: enoyl-CoA hydratase, partial [Candidatus Hydrogenedentota bacterium]
MRTLRTETTNGVRSIVFCRGKEYNTITPQLRDELAEAVEDADADPAVRVMLLRAEGPAFCAGYGLDWSTEAQAQEMAVGASRAEREGSRVWDSVADLRIMSTFVDT